jgi:hypothetical protein
MIMFNVGDIVTFEESIPGKIIDVMVDKDNDTVYLVDFKNSCGLFLAKDLKLVEKRD